MIALHRLAARSHQPILVNPDLVVSIEATPDTVVALATGAKLVVAEAPEDVVESVRAWRRSITVPGSLLEGQGAGADYSER